MYLVHFSILVPGIFLNQKAQVDADTVLFFLITDRINAVRGYPTVSRVMCFVERVHLKIRLGS